MLSPEVPVATDTLIGRLARLAETGGSTLTFVDRKEREIVVSCASVWEGSRRVAGALTAHGVLPGDRVAVVLPTGPAVVQALFAAQIVGAIPTLLATPPRLGGLMEYADRTAAALRAAGVTWVIAEAAAHAALEHVADQVGSVVVLDAAALDLGPLAPIPAVDADAIALVQFSSGTTVAPKPVALTHRQILANCDAIHPLLHPDGVDAVHVLWLPLYHDMGLVGGLLLTLLYGVPGVLMAPDVFIGRPSAWLRAISRYRATVTIAPNFAFGVVTTHVSDAELDGVDLSCLGWVLCGAEPVSAAVARRFITRFEPFGLPNTAFVPVYGLAEATVAVSFGPFRTREFRTFRADRRALGEGRLVPGEGLEIVSVGRALRDIEIEVRGDDGVPRAAAAVGRVWIRSPGQMSGYLDRDDAPIRDGWLDTGDLGALLDGELYLTGRAKDVIILQGENHLPHDIEEATWTVPGVRVGRSAAVAEVAEEGERLLVFVEVKEVSDALAEACRRAVLAAIGVPPHRVVQLPAGALPRTTSGKIRRAEALRRWQDGSLGAEATE